ncbi:hypothetical protein J7643_04485 [bacterium]|nr:hypothetical protein [bacterium]
MKHALLLLLSVFTMGWGLAQGGALAAPGEAKQQSSLKDLGKPAYKDTVLTREQYLKQQEEFKRLAEAERAQAIRFKQAFGALREEFAKEGIKIHRPKQSDAWHLVVPELSKVGAQAQKTKGKAIVTRFKAKMEPLLKEKIMVEVYPDAKQTKPLSL